MKLVSFLRSGDEKGFDTTLAFVSAAAASAQNKPSALQKSRAVIGFGGQGKDSSAAARDRKGDDGSQKIGEVSLIWQ